MRQRNKIILVLIFIVLLAFPITQAEKQYYAFITQTINYTNNITIYNSTLINITNNITNNITIENNITNNYYTTNNITIENNITYNITNNITNNITYNITNNYSILADNNYLYTDTITMFFNETKLNATIDNRSPYFSLPPYIAFTNQTNYFNYSQHINEGEIFGFRGLLDNDTYFFYNATNQTLWLVVNGRLQQSWGNSTTIYETATFQDNAIFGNITGEGIILDANLISLKNVSANILKENGTRICLSNGTNCQLTTANLTHKQGDNIYLYNDTTTIYMNETKLNSTISNISKVIAYTLNLTIDTSSQSFNISSENIEYMITQITIIPSSNSTTYKFQLMEYPSYDIIDRDLITHKGIWNIKKAYALNSQVIANITLSNPNDLYTIQIKYIKNG